MPSIDSAPIQIAAWLACLAFFVGLLNGLMKLWDRASGKSKSVQITPPQLELREATVFVRKEECVGRHQQAENKFGILERQLADLKQERHEDATMLHEKVNNVANRVAGLEVETKTQNNWLSRMDSKLDSINKKV